MITFKKGIYLRAIEQRDLSKLRNWRNDPRINRWCRQNDMISEINQEKWFQKINSDPSIKMYAICLNGMSEHSSLDPGCEFDPIIGVCGLTDIDMHNSRAEFSLYIGPEWQKLGHAKKSLLTLFHHGFSSLNLKTIWGETFSNNPAQYLFEKIGMVKEGERRDFYFKDGQYWGAYLYSITRPEFIERFKNPCSL